MRTFHLERVTTIYVAIAVLLFIASLGSVVWRSFSASTAEASRSSLDGQISELSALVQSRPDEVKNYLALANVYLQKTREDGDIAHYFTIEELLGRAALIDPKNADVDAINAMIANGRHNFMRGKELVDKAIIKNPEVASYYGIRADAEVELGKYDMAIATLQTMINKKPNYSAYTRIAYLRELYGDTEGALEVLALAINAGSNFKENISWAYVESGKLRARNDLAGAELNYKQALVLVPNYPPALEGLGKIAFARGDMRNAEEYFMEAFASLPLATYATDLGDLYASQGNQQKAQQQYALAEIAFQKASESGMNTDLEYAVFLADHGDPRLALEKALRAYELRPSISGADALAWAYYKNEAFKESLGYSVLALRLGEHDPLIVFHAGMIAEANGELARATTLFNRATKLNPHFSLFYANSQKLKVQ